MHDFIPIFPRDNTEENSDGLARRREVGMPANKERETEADISMKLYSTRSSVVYTACSAHQRGVGDTQRDERQGQVNKQRRATLTG